MGKLKVLSFFCMISLSPLLIAQSDISKTGSAYHLPDNTTIVPIIPDNITDSWVPIDTMVNSFSMAQPTCSAIEYDPWADVLVMVYRGKTSSDGGSIYYRYSTNRGQTWVKVAKPVNTGTQSTLMGRYPSVRLSNPTHSTDKNQVGVSFAWILNPVAGGSGDYYLGGSNDEHIGAGVYKSFTRTTGSGFDLRYAFWVSDDSPARYWLSTVFGSQVKYRLYRSADNITVDSIDSPVLNSLAELGGCKIMGGYSKGDVSYLAVFGTFKLPDTTMPAIKSGYLPAVAKSTDHGLTWDHWEVIDFRKISTLTNYDRLFNYNKSDSYSEFFDGTIIVDNDKLPHLFFSVTDTIASGNSGKNSIVEVYKTGSGIWEAKIVYAGIGDNAYKLDGPGAGQTGTSLSVTVDKLTSALAVQWVMPPTLADSICEIFVGGRYLNSGSYATMFNITNTRTINENSAHLSRYFRFAGSCPRIFSLYNYEAGNSGYLVNPNNPSVIYARDSFLGADCPSDPLGTEPPVQAADEFDLEQNYPNPFNPATTIVFKLSEKSDISLIVSDILGNTIEELACGAYSRGRHSVVWNASSFSSGVYFYSLKANGRLLTKKLLLLK